jgi:hypothetical protein
MSDSFFPAARKVIQNPVVKWVLGLAVGLTSAAITTGVWPFFRGWVATRADTDSVSALEHRVAVMEKDHLVDYVHLDSAKSDDTGTLNTGEQLQWSLLRIKRLQMRVVIEIRYGVGLEAKLRMPNPRSEQAKRTAALVRSKFDELMLRGEDDPTVAATKALDLVFGSMDN